MIFKGLMQRYKESLKNTPGPVRLQDLSPMVIDYRGLLAYAKEKGGAAWFAFRTREDGFCT